MDIMCIKTYREETSRHHLYFTQSEIQGITCLDVGNELSKAIENDMGKKQLPMITEEKLNRLVEHFTVNLADIGDIVALTNIGILFEPALQINIHDKLDYYSRSRNVVVSMRESLIIDDRFYLSGCKNKRYSIDLKDITYKELQDEI